MSAVDDYDFGAHFPESGEAASLEGVDQVDPGAFEMRQTVHQKLLQDPQQRYSNPYTIDWTTTPIAAMRLTIEAAEQTVSEIPGTVNEVLRAALVDAEEANRDTVEQMTVSIRRALMGEKRQADGFRGPLLEMRDQVVQQHELVAQHRQGLDVHASLNRDLTRLVKLMQERASALELAITEREAALQKRENTVSQREANLKKKLSDFESRGFWGHFGHACLGLAKNPAGATIGFVLLLVFAGAAVRGIATLLP